LLFLRRQESGKKIILLVIENFKQFQKEFFKMWVIILILAWFISGYFLILFKNLKIDKLNKKENIKKEANSNLKGWIDSILNIKVNLKYPGLKKIIGFSIITVVFSFGFLLNSLIIKQAKFDVKFENLYSRMIEVEDILKQIEKNSDNLTLFFSDINEARQQLKKLDEFDKTAKEKTAEISDVLDKANQDLTNIGAIAEFNLLITEAMHDDRKAFEKLKTIANSSESIFQKSAMRIMYKILGKLKYPTEVVYTINWEQLGFVPSEFGFKSLEELILIYNNLLYSSKLEFLNTIWNNRDFSKYKCLEFLIYVIQTENSLELLGKACEYFNQETGLEKNILNSEEYTKWWERNKEKYKD
jgi:hypothetical protein